MMKSRQFWNWATWLLWLLPVAVIAFSIVAHPLNRSTTQIYREAVESWSALRSVYTGSQGLNYLPVFIPFFSIFSWFSLPLGELLWRAVTVIGLYLGLRRWTGLVDRSNRDRAFFFVTVLALPLCVSSFRNGQSSGQLAASLVFAAWYLHGQRLGWAALWLCIALVCKPLAIPAIGLAVMAYPGLWWRVLPGALAVLLAPYLFAPASYVNDLYVSFAVNIVDCFNPSGRTFADLNGVLMAVNVKLSGVPSLVVRVAAGLAMAIGCWQLRESRDDIRKALLWLGLTGSYIMLFTPMNEANSYVMLAPSLALWALWFSENDEKGTARVVAAMSLTMFVLPDLVGIAFEKQVGSEFAKFLYPLLTLVFVAILLRQMMRIISEAQHAGVLSPEPVAQEGRLL